MRIINNGDISVPKIFFDLLPALSDEQIRIYLLLLSDDGSCTFESLSSDLGMDSEHVIMTFIALKNKGLIAFDENAPGVNPDIKILRDAPDPMASIKRIPKSDKNLKEFMDEVSAVTGRILSSSDAKFIIECIDKYDIPKEVILEGFKVSKEKGYRGNLYVKTLVMSWADRGITTAEEARELYNKPKYPDIVYKSLSALGRYEIPTAAEADIVSKWVNDFGFTDDMIMLACQKTSVNTSRNRLKYCDGILSDWAKKNIKTKDDYDKSIRPVSKKTAYGIPCEPCDFEELEKKLLDN